jgi:hypothetical protein
MPALVDGVKGGHLHQIPGYLLGRPGDGGAMPFLGALA